MSYNKLTELNLICVYCNKLNHIEDPNLINELMQDPFFNCQYCNNILEILQIEDHKINKVNIKELR